MIARLLKKTCILSFILFFCSINSWSQDIAINEIMSSNELTLADEDGEFNDWIEIYNYGNTTVNLSGYGLSDQTDDASKWVFPAISIEANQYLLVWASGKNRGDASSELHSNFKIKSGGEAIILSNASGTKLSESPAVAISTDSSYGRSPDGTGSWSVFSTSTPGLSNTGETGSSTEEIAINEIMSSNDAAVADEDGEFNDWIEIYNYGTESIDLEGFGLSDEKELPYKWVFPSTTIAPDQYILVWASEKDRAASGSELHTNFKISSGGETLVLTNKTGGLVSGSPSISLNSDVSYGRQPNGIGAWFYFDAPTPLASNDGTGATTELKPPVFSHDAGLYVDAFDLSLTTNIQGGVIVYTLDGSVPDINNLNGSSFTYKNEYPYEITDDFGAFLTQDYQSFTYSAPISISDRSNDEDVLARKNTVAGDIYIPPVSVRKSTVLRARVYVNGKGSKTTTKTYFVWPEGNPYSVPVLSLTTFEGNIFGYEKGIYTAGITFDEWRIAEPTGNQPNRAEFNNYGQDGVEWEREVNVQLFDSNLKSILSQDAGIRIHGNTSRADIIKNLRLYARSEYDEESKFEMNLFKDKIPGSPDPYNNKFKRLMLRGNGSGGQIANDMVFSRLMQPFFNGVMRIQTAVSYINGEYFGITAVRDRFDVHHIANNFNLDSDNVSIVSCIGSCANADGTDNPERVLRHLFRPTALADGDLASDENYKKITDVLNIESFIDHLVLEIFAEGDSYETKYWKATTPVDDGYGDGRFQIYTQDFEAAMASNRNWLSDFSEDSNAWQRNIFPNLIDNEGFRIQFISRTADLLNTAFTKDRFDAIVNATFEEITPLLEEDRNRSPRLRFYEDGDKVKLLEWIVERPGIFRTQINELFNIEKTIDLDIDVSNPNAGFITVNTVDIKSTTPGVQAQPYPWSGVYFDNIPITLEATPKEGYVFSHWSGDATGSDSKITISSSSDLLVRAIFTPDEDFSHLLYFWLLDDDIANDTPLQNLNSTYSRNNLTANLDYNSSLSGYPFEANNANWRKASLERINKPTAINYQSLGNDDISYDSEMMNGLQIKQPFQSDDLENNFELDFSTIGYEDIKISLAINSDGAANTIIAEYWNGSNWVFSDLSNNSQSINSEYQRIEFDFSTVSIADENESFKVRFRFSGINMTEDTGKKVVLNNIAITAVDKDVLSAKEYIEQKQNLRIYPNPAKDKIKIFSNNSINKVLVYNVFGKLVYKSSNKSTNLAIDISNFSKGVYLVKAFSNDETITKKIIKE